MLQAQRRSWRLNQHVQPTWVQVVLEHGNFWACDGSNFSCWNIPVMTWVDVNGPFCYRFHMFQLFLGGTAGAKSGRMVDWEEDLAATNVDILGCQVSIKISHETINESNIIGHHWHIWNHRNLKHIIYQVFFLYLVFFFKIICSSSSTVGFSRSMDWCRVRSSP